MIIPRKPHSANCVVHSHLWLQWHAFRTRERVNFGFPGVAAILNFLKGIFYNNKKSYFLKLLYSQCTQRINLKNRCRLSLKLVKNNNVKALADYLFVVKPAEKSAYGVKWCSLVPQIDVGLLGTYHGQRHSNPQSQSMGSC